MPVMFLSAFHFAWLVGTSEIPSKISYTNFILLSIHICLAKQVIVVYWELKKQLFKKINIKLFVCKIVLQVISYDIVNIRKPVNCKEHVLNTDLLEDSSKCNGYKISIRSLVQLGMSMWY
jgi:hypothetical protein